MEKINWTDRVRNEEVLHRVKEERNILHTLKRSNANWISYILRRNCLPKHVTEGKIEGTGRQGRRRKKQLDDIKEKRRSHSVQNSLWKRLWACRKTDYAVNELTPCSRVPTSTSQEIEPLYETQSFTTVFTTARQTHNFL
jgi:hypothetical protein